MVNPSFNSVSGELSYTNDQAAVRDLWSSPEPLNEEGLSTLQDSQIPMTSTNTTTEPEDQNQAMKAVVGGSAADILKAMLKERQRRQEGELFDCINSSLRIRKNR